MNRPNSVRRTTVRLVSGAALLSLVLAGCSSSDDSSGPAAGATSSAAAACDSVDKVTVVLQWVTQGQFAGYYAALDKGYYADRCLDVTIQEGGSNVVPQQVLASGNAEFAVSHVTKSMVSRAEGADVVNIGQVFERGAYYQVAWADSGITSLADLKGTTMGSWGSGNELVLYAALRDQGVEPTTDIDVVQQPFDMSLLLDRQADSVQAKPYNEYAQLLETVNPDTGELYQPEDFSVIDLQEEGYASLEDGIYARGEWLAEDGNEDVATRFLAASYQGWITCRDDQAGCVDIIVKYGSALGKSHQTWTMNEVDKLIWPSTSGGIGTMDKAAWDQTIQNAIDGGVLESPADEGAYRTDLTEAAQKLLTDEGLDIVGEGWTPAEVALVEGGK